MAGRKSDFTLTKLDDLFSTQEQRDEEKLSKIRDIPLTEIDDFPDHPFKVRDDEDMAQLIESIKERGVITPATVIVNYKFFQLTLQFTHIRRVRTNNRIFLTHNCSLFCKLQHLWKRIVYPRH